MMKEQPHGDWMNDETDWDESTYCFGGQGKTCEEVQDSANVVMAAMLGAFTLVCVALIVWGMMQ